MLSINGFAPGAVEAVRRKATRLLLMDGPDLAVVLEGGLQLDELCERLI